MLKEFLIFLRIAWAIDKEEYLKTKLAKHHCKMTAILERYKYSEFKNNATKDQYRYLHVGVMSRWYGDKKGED